MKRSWKCPTCEGEKIGYLPSLPDSTDATEQPIARVVGVAPVGAFGGVERAGKLEAFVCTECGYLEEYVNEAASIDWSTVKGFRWCTPTPFSQ